MNDKVRKLLQDLNLLQENGQPHDTIRNIVLSAITGEGLDMQLVSPIANPDGAMSAILKSMAASAIALGVMATPVGAQQPGGVLLDTSKIKKRQATPEEVKRMEDLQDLILKSRPKDGSPFWVVPEEPNKDKKDKAMNDLGGIDLSQQDAALHVVKDANGGVVVNVDPAFDHAVLQESTRLPLSEGSLLSHLTYRNAGGSPGDHQHAARGYTIPVWS